MGTVIIGGGPRPGAAIYNVQSADQVGTPHSEFWIEDNGEVLAKCKFMAHALILLQKIRSGE